ncbi:MAG: transcription termination/antitermination protein NusA, partial [Rhizobiales bacterium]|nr:transcription termination/antitermination protein NusA [Hyphomicrobiales bacterium]
AIIEGFDDGTAQEIQTRAREYLDKLEAEQEVERKKLGVADELRDIEGITTAMMVAFGNNDVKSVEDLGYCAVDDLVGWSERKDGEVTRFDGVFNPAEMSRAEAEALIMTARLKSGLITEEDLAPAEPTEEEELVEGETAQ